MAEIIPILRNQDNFDKQIKILTDLCKEDLESINTLIIEKLDSSVPLISKITSYLMISGGKRLRPLLTSSCFNLIEKKTKLPLKHIGLAAAVEFIHAATLLHDDVVDDSKNRRGSLTANEVWGNKTNPTSSSESIRSSYGYGIKWYSPIGPLGFSWAYPIQDEDYDIKRSFLFSIGNIN